MASTQDLDPHSLGLFLEYKQLRAATFGQFLAEIGQQADSITAHYGRLRGLRPDQCPALLIEAADTSNSIKLTLGEGWLPQVTSDEEHDIVVSVPKKLGIPLVVGYLILNGASRVLDIRNDYLDSQIKTIELQLKESELRETLYGDRGVFPELAEASQETVRRVLDDEDIESFRLYGADLVAIRRKEEDDIST
jgi:hypothetical protein